MNKWRIRYKPHHGEPQEDIIETVDNHAPHAFRVWSLGKNLNFIDLKSVEVIWVYGDQVFPEIPMCWKCTFAIMKQQNDKSKILIGCKRKPSITNYKLADEHCPLLGSNSDQDSNGG